MAVFRGSVEVFPSQQEPPQVPHPPKQNHPVALSLFGTAQSGPYRSSV